MDTKLEVNELLCSYAHGNCKSVFSFFIQIYDGDDYSLEGDMSVPSAKRNTTQPGQPDFNTLDEPIKETIVSIISLLNKSLFNRFSLFQLRDVRAVGIKFYHVLYPKEKSTLLKECK